MSTIPSVENPPPPPPRSRARGRTSTQKDGEEEADETEEVTMLQREITTKEQRIASLETELQSAKAAHDEILERSSNWLQEREEFRSQIQELTTQLQTERERADTAEERVRDLRRTAEESRRAIMVLSSSKNKNEAQRTDTNTDRGSRRNNHSLNTLTSRALSSFHFENEADDSRSLKGLRLSSGSSVTSPTPPASETFAPIKDEDTPASETTPRSELSTPEVGQMDSATDTPEPHLNDTEKASPDMAKSEDTNTGASANTFTSMFGKTSLLRPNFSLLRKPASTATVAPTDTEVPLDEQAEYQVDHSTSKADMERAQLELKELRTQLMLLQDQLMESKEAEQASEQCIRSLREFIVNSQGGADTRVETEKTPDDSKNHVEERLQTALHAEPKEDTMPTPSSLVENDGKPSTAPSSPIEDVAVADAITTDSSDTVPTEAMPGTVHVTAEELDEEPLTTHESEPNLDPTEDAQSSETKSANDHVDEN
ncbi:hypothetical protein MPSI1_003092 [Malassezia psittaci]|uniref:Uncharacterized protein n=1 Tax=Malassezia psittaci TaxID=1821823 RepID=A0AAF0FCT6_9BASI|nr:hypothetical protein MPSI1_003092 [Malassezia psittaci]